MLRKIPWLAKLMMLGSVGLYSWSAPSFANFYTVIGPDGRPIVIQDQRQTQQIKVSPNTAAPAQSGQIQGKTGDSAPDPVAIEKSSVEKTSHAEPRVENTKLTEAPKLPVEKTAVSQSKAEINHVKTDTVKVVPLEKNQGTITQPERSQIVPDQLQHSPQIKSHQIDNKANPQQILPSDVKSTAPITTQPKIVEEAPKVALPIGTTQESVAKVSQAEPATQPSVTPETRSAVVEIDGVQYVNSEYLEEREFNIEGKKRFYVMPEVSSGGGHNIHTVEREKGVSKSFLDRLWKKTDESAEAVVLSVNYQRLAQEDVVAALEQSCFQGSKLTKAKTLGAKNSEVGYWPVAPIKEKFAYEVAKLEHSVHNILLTSYASSKKSPQYYWPFVVFLDEKGCVIEGVSGFKTAKVEENAIHQAHMEGVLRKPEHAVYLFMTPLESALDVEGMALSNQGQIKLTVIE